MQEGKNRAAQAALLEAVQSLLAAKESIDRQLAECLEKLQGACVSTGRQLERDRDSGVQTPPAERARKRPRDTAESEEGSTSLHQPIPEGWPCRVDLSNLASLLLTESLQHHAEIEKHLSEKKLKLFYPYGNYPNYYAYRLTGAATKDPRIEKAWFCGKACLDVGSHQGVMTLGLVTEFTPKSMMGVEIDASLCEKAHCLQSELLRTYKRRQCRQVIASLKRTQFLNEDFLNLSSMENAFDVVTCLSVSKWIHFHSGDGGMKHLFHLFWQILKPNGLLLFEPQSLKSYRQATKKLDVSCIPYPVSEMQFLPDQFLSYLTEEVGFDLLETIQFKTDSKGFERPIYRLKREE